MTKHPLQQLADYGQSFWYDGISRDVIQNGDLRKLVEEDGLRGLTSNPTIFEQAIAKSGLYDETIRREAARGRPAVEIFDALQKEDIQSACDILRPVFDRTEGADGFVSIEVSPLLARDREASLREARRLRKIVDRPNVLVKVPATPECIPAIRQLLAEGVNINITLMFGLENYEQVVQAYVGALEERVAKGLPVDGIRSVASIFVSRIDTKIDGWIDAMVKAETDADRRERLRSLRGKLAIANAKLCYQRYKAITGSARFKRLAAKGAHTQRILFASTSTKDPTYPDTYYIAPLIGKDTVTTMAPVTVPAFRDHGTVAHAIELGAKEAEEAFRTATSLGIDIAKAMKELQDEGVTKFSDSYSSLLKTIEKKTQALAGARGG